MRFLAMREQFYGGYILSGTLYRLAVVIFFDWGTYRSSLWFFDVFIYVMFVLITSIMMVAAVMTKVSCIVDIFVFYVPFHEWLEFL